MENGPLLDVPIKDFHGWFGGFPASHDYCNWMVYQFALKTATSDFPQQTLIVIGRGYWQRVYQNVTIIFNLYSIYKYCIKIYLYIYIYLHIHISYLMNSDGHGDGIAAVAFQRLFFIQTPLQKQRITENRKHTILFFPAARAQVFVLRLSFS